MAKILSLKGFLNKDENNDPIKEYDDTELREMIQTNTEDIDNLKSRTTSLESAVFGDEGATEGNLASYDKDGKLVDSQFSPYDFAPAVHGHDEIKVVEASSGQYGAVYVDNHNQDDPNIVLELKDTNNNVKQAVIDLEGLDNLSRALRNPAAPAANGQDPITNGQVYTALQEKSDINHNHNSVYAPKTHTHFITEIPGLDEYLVALSARVTALEDAVAPVSWETVEEIILGTPSTAGQNRYSSGDNNLFGLTHHADYRIGDRVRLAGITDTEIVVEGEILAKPTTPNRILLSIDLSSITNNGYHYNLQKVAASNNE